MTDRETAISILTRVAAELVRGDLLPSLECADSSCLACKREPVIRKAMHRRGREIAKAIELLRKDKTK